MRLDEAINKLKTDKRVNRVISMNLPMVIEYSLNADESLTRALLNKYRQVMVSVGLDDNDHYYKSEWLLEYKDDIKPEERSEFKHRSKKVEGKQMELNEAIKKLKTDKRVRSIICTTLPFPVKYTINDDGSLNRTVTTIYKKRMEMESDNDYCEDWDLVYDSTEELSEFLEKTLNMPEKGEESLFDKYMKPGNIVTARFGRQYWLSMRGDKLYVYPIVINETPSDVFDHGFTMTVKLNTKVHEASFLWSAFLTSKQHDSMDIVNISTIIDSDCYGNISTQTIWIRDAEQKLKELTGKKHTIMEDR